MRTNTVYVEKLAVVSPADTTLPIVLCVADHKVRAVRNGELHRGFCCGACASILVYGERWRVEHATYWCVCKTLNAVSAVDMPVLIDGSIEGWPRDAQQNARGAMPQ